MPIFPTLGGSSNSRDASSRAPPGQKLKLGRSDPSSGRVFLRTQGRDRTGPAAVQVSRLAPDGCGATSQGCCPRLDGHGRGSQPPRFVALASKTWSGKVFHRDAAVPRKRFLCAKDTKAGLADSAPFPSAFAAVGSTLEAPSTPGSLSRG